MLRPYLDKTILNASLSLAKATNTQRSRKFFDNDRRNDLSRELILSEKIEVEKRDKKFFQNNLTLTGIFFNFQEMISLNDARMNHQRQNFL